MKVYFIFTGYRTVCFLYFSLATFGCPSCFAFFPHFHCVCSDLKCFESFIYYDPQYFHKLIKIFCTSCWSSFMCSPLPLLCVRDHAHTCLHICVRMDCMCVYLCGICLHLSLSLSLCNYFHVPFVCACMCACLPLFPSPVCICVSHSI